MSIGNKLHEMEKTGELGFMEALAISTALVNLVRDYEGLGEHLPSLNKGILERARVILLNMCPDWKFDFYFDRGTGDTEHLIIIEPTLDMAVQTFRKRFPGAQCVRIVIDRTDGEVYSYTRDGHLYTIG